MDDLISKSKRGFRWVFSSNVIKGGIGFVTLLFLGKQLGAESLGLISILKVIYGISDTLVQFGISQSIIARDENTKEELSSIFWTNVAIGFSIFIGINLLSGLIARFYDQMELQRFILVLSIIFLIEPLDLIFRALLEKDLRFRTLEIGNLIRVISLFVFIVILVLLGLDVMGYIYALIISMVLSTIFYSIVFIKEKIWFPSFHFRIKDIKEHYKFGFYVTAKSFLNFAGRNIDELIIGKFLGMEQLGVYYFAKRLVENPAQFFTASLSKIVFPFFSRLKSDIKSVKRYYLKISHLLAVLGIPFMVITCIVAPYLISTLFSNKWDAAIILIQIFSIIAIIRILSSGLNTALFYSYNQPKLVFVIDLIFAVMRISLFIWAATVSLNAVVLISLSILFTKTITSRAMIHKLIDSSFKELIKSIYKPFAYGAFSAVLALLVLLLFRSFGAMAGFVSGTITFACLYYIFFTRFDNDIFSFLKREVRFVKKEKTNVD